MLKKLKNNPFPASWLVLFLTQAGLFSLLSLFNPIRINTEYLVLMV